MGRKKRTADIPWQELVDSDSRRTRAYDAAPFIARRRLSRKPLNADDMGPLQQLEARWEMAYTFGKLRTGSLEAAPGLTFMLQLAADTRVEKARRAILRRWHGASIRAGRQIEQLIKDLIVTVRRLPPASLSPLNKVTAKFTTQLIDLELLESLTKEWHSELDTIEPKRRARAIQELLFKPAPVYFDYAPPAGFLQRPSRSDLVELWEMIPGWTRSWIADEFRKHKPIRTTLEFLSCFLKFLRSAPKPKPKFKSRAALFLEGTKALGIKPTRGRHVLPVIAPSQRTAKIDGVKPLRRQAQAPKTAWQDFSYHRKSLYQRLCTAAIKAAGDKLSITDYLVRKLKTRRT
jgi:hypothetical protein